MPAAGPLVSVLLPAYNSAGHVERSLESALSQTMPDLEVVFVDDASSDGTVAVAEAVAARDPRVRVLRNAQNLGTSATVNRAIREARGAWVAQLDHDDLWRPERLARLLEHADDADVVSDDIEIVVDEARDDRHGFRAGSMLAQVGLLVDAPRRLGLVEFVGADPGLVHPLLRRSFLREHDLELDPAYAIGADFKLWVLLLAHGARWVQLPDAYYVWSRAVGAQSRDLQREVEEAVRLTPELVQHPLIEGNRPLTRALRGRERLLRSHLANRLVRERLGGRRFGDLRPADVGLVLWRKAYYLRLRARGAYRGWRAPPRLTAGC